MRWEDDHELLNWQEQVRRRSWVIWMYYLGVRIAILRKTKKTAQPKPGRDS